MMVFLEPVVIAERSLTGSMAAALAARNIVGTDAEILIAEVLQMYQLVKAGSVMPAAAASSVGGAGTRASGRREGSGN